MTNFSFTVNDVEPIPNGDLRYEYSSASSTSYVFLWKHSANSGYDNCQLMGGIDRGIQTVTKSGGSVTSNHAAGFHTGADGKIRADIYDQLWKIESSSSLATDAFLKSYPLEGSAIAEPESKLIMGGRYSYGVPGTNTYVTRGGDVLLDDYDVQTATYRYAVSAGQGEVPANQNSTLTSLPGGGVALGGPGAGLRVIKGGAFKDSSITGVTEIDELGTGIGGVTLQQPSTNGHDIWRNGEWFSLKDATGNTDLNALIAPQRITSKGIIWAGDIQKINNGILVPLQLVSRDKFLAGSFEVPEGWETSELEFLGPEGSLGKYGKLLGGGTTKIYGKVEDVLDAPDLTGAGGQPDEQQVWFVRNAINPRKVDFYTCFNETGDVHVVLHVNGHMVGETIHQLTPDADFAHFIDYVDQWVKGTGFNSTGGGTDPPLALRSRGMERALADGGIHNLSRAALIPFFNVIGNVENLGSVAVGLFDGVKNGISDDWELIQLITNGVVTGGGWAYEQAEAELLKWRSDPRKRAVELKQAADRLCKEWVFKPMSELGSDLSTWEGFKKRSWSAWEVTKRTGVRSWALTQSAWESIKTGMSTWADDFGNRMLAGAEKAHWTGAPWNMSQLQGDINEYSRRASYIFGYTFGYVGEQAAICLLTGGSAEIANVMARGGVEAASLLAARKVLPMAARLHLVKKWAASTAVSIEMKIALERGLTLAAETPISAVLKDSCAEVIERGMARLSYERGAFSSFHILDEILNAPFIKKLCQTAGHEGQFWEQLARYFHIMEEKATAPASKGWVKAYNRSLKFEGEVLIDDRADDLFKIFKTETEEGREALRKSLQEFGETDGNGKFWFKDVEKVYDYLYHHFPATGANRLIIKNGNVYLREFSGERGWYVTGTKIDYQGPAKDLLQLPYIENGRYRCKFSTAQAKDKLKIPRGQQNEAEFFECLAKDYPDNGNGLGTQLLLEQKEVALEEIFDTVLQRALTAQEIELLINP